MRRQSITSISLLVCLTAVVATTVSAQSNRRFIIRIPFQFIIAGRTLPAGKYAVERIDPTKPNVLLLKNTDNDNARLFITQHVENDDAGKASCLIFKLRNGKYHLFQLWMLGYKEGHQVPLADGHEGHDQRDRNPALVTVKANNQRP